MKWEEGNSEASALKQASNQAVLLFLYRGGGVGISQYTIVSLWFLVFIFLSRSRSFCVDDFRRTLGQVSN